MELVVKTRDGAPVTHDVTKNTVRMVGADGEAKDFVSADDVPKQVEKTVALDFSGGDMVVEPEDGKVFSSVNLPVPANLIPANIAAGVDIVGIIGTFTGGGNVKFSSATFKGGSPNTGSFRISVDFGFAPDVIVVCTKTSIPQTSNISYLTHIIGFSNAFGSVFGGLPQMYKGETRKDTFFRGEYARAIDDDDDGSTYCIHSADKTGFSLRTTTYSLATYQIYAFKLV